MRSPVGHADPCLLEDEDLLRGGGGFVRDLLPSDAAHAVFVRSAVPSARLRAVELSRATASPGVLGVFVGPDLGLSPQAPPPPLHQAMRRPLLASGVVRFVGEPVAVVVAETPQAAVDAAELVRVDYDPLPSIATASESVGANHLLFPSAGTNVAFHTVLGHDIGPAAAEVVVRHEFANQRVAACPLEPRSVIASWEGEDRLTFWASTQSPHGVRAELASCFGLPVGAVRVISPAVGGGFGSKISLYPEELVVAWAARRLQATVAWFETRSESLLSLGHGRAQLQSVELRGSRDGTLTAYRLSVLQDAGAYPRDGAFHPMLTGAMASGPYRIPRVEFQGLSAVTNTMSIVVYRGAGQPEATAALERAVDLFSATIGMDPAEVRRRNLIGADEFPYRNSTGTTYDSGDLERALDAALQLSRYPAVRAEQAVRRRGQDPRQLGVGIALYVASSNNAPYSEFGSVTMSPDATVRALSGARPQGQGHERAFAHLIGLQLGIASSDVTVILGDTGLVPEGVGTMAARTLQTAGMALVRATADLIEQGRRVAARLLGTSHHRVSFDSTAGAFLDQDGRALSWAVVAAAAAARPDRSLGGSLSAVARFTAPGPTCPSGANIAIVEVDVETGEVALQRLISVDDAGRRLFPTLADGQIRGGLAQGCGQALTEQFVYDASARPLTTSLQRYGFITASKLPAFETHAIECPSPMNELGVKGIGEVGAIGSPAAVQNAVVDAVRHLGVDHIEMPLLPERVWRALQAAQERDARRPSAPPDP
jgi:carbon-monoxide dehydrogenase large subunit